MAVTIVRQDQEVIELEITTNGESMEEMRRRSNEVDCATKMNLNPYKIFDARWYVSTKATYRLVILKPVLFKDEIGEIAPVYEGIRLGLELVTPEIMVHLFLAMSEDDMRDLGIEKIVGMVIAPDEYGHPRGISLSHRKMGFFLNMSHQDCMGMDVPTAAIFMKAA